VERKRDDNVHEHTKKIFAKFLKVFNNFNVTHFALNALNSLVQRLELNESLQKLFQ
jgi:hypothetical protein